MATKPLKNNTAEIQGAGPQNSRLRKAAAAKNDEFYTKLADIENELSHYTRHFKGKTVFCNCDDPLSSNFWRYFDINFDFLGLERLVSTHYERGGTSYKLEVTRGSGGAPRIVKTMLEGNGDFRSAECVDILRKADIVVTNPPFSLFREYIAQLAEFGKKFIVIGNNNAISFKEIFRLIRANKLWLGVNSNKTLEFELAPTYGKWKRMDKDGRKFAEVPAISWFTNLHHRKRNEELILFRQYNPKDYPKYTNYGAIEVSQVKNIPMDYEGQMGVPITFLSKFNPDQFEIIDINPHFFAMQEQGLAKPAQLSLPGQEDPYARIIIKRRVSQ